MVHPRPCEPGRPFVHRINQKRRAVGLAVHRANRNPTLWVHEFHEPTEKGFFLTKSVDLDFDAKGLETFRGYETIGPWMEKDYPKKGNYLVVVLRQKLTGELAAAQADLNANEIAY